MNVRGCVKKYIFKDLHTYVESWSIVSKWIISLKKLKIVIQITWSFKFT